MRVRHLKLAEIQPTPWKNGGGMTREIAVGPEGAGLEDFLWRLSVAEVAASGPFSAFPGIDRTLTLLQGDGLKLDFEEGDDLVIDVRWRPAAFDGGRLCQGRLIGGPVTDFNVMSRRGRVSHRVRPVDLSDQELTESLENEVTAILVLEGGVEAAVGGERAALAPRELLLVEREAGERGTWKLAAAAETRALIVEIDLSIARPAGA